VYRAYKYIHRKNVYAKMNGNNKTKFGKIATLRINIKTKLQNEPNKIHSSLLIITIADTETH
jgi:hypothetical protein